MAGKPVGTMFAEIGLDSTKLERSLESTHKKLVDGTIKVEDSYKSLGIKSDQVYEQMRRNATAAVDFIKNKTLSSKEEIVRAEQAAANRIKQINEQQYGAHVSMLDKMKQNWIATSAVVLAAWAAVNKAMAWAELGAKAMQAEESFRIVAASAGESADKILAGMKRAAAGTVDDSDIMQKAVKGMVLGLKGDEMIKIMEVARTSARVAGEDVVTAYEGITDAIATQMPKALKRYGLITMDEMALVKRAMKEGIEDVDLYTLAMLNAGIQAEKMGQMHRNAAENIQAFHAQVKEMKESFGKLTISVETELMVVWKKFFGFVIGAAQGMATMLSLIPGDIGKAGKEAQEELGKWRRFAEEDIKKLRGIQSDEEKKAAQEEAGGAAERIAAAEKEKKAWLDKLKAQIEAAKHAKDAHRDEMEILKANLAAGQAAYEMAVKTAEAAANASQDAGRNELSTIDDLFDAKARAANAWLDIRLRTAEQEVAYEAKYAKVAYDADAVLLAKKKAIYLDYTKIWTDNEEKKAFSVVEYAKRNVAVEAQLYKTIDQYSAETVQAEIAALAIKYLELGRYTANRLLLIAARNKEELMIYENAAMTEAEIKRKYTEDVKGPYSSEYRAAFAAALNAQADLEQIKVGESFDRQAWLTVKTQEEDLKRLSSAADFYKEIEGYEQKWFDTKMGWIEEERARRALIYGDEVAAAMWAAEEERKLAVEKFDMQHKFVNLAITNSQKMFDAASGLFKKESHEYKLMQDLKKVMQFAEMAMQAKKNLVILLGYQQKTVAAAAAGVVESTANTSAAVTGAAAAITKQGSGDPYTAFPRIAAMIALMTSVLSMAGIAFGGGSAGSSAAPAPVLPASTVLGAEAGTGSESISKSYELLKDTYTMEYRELSGIHDSMKDLNNNIIALVTSIVRTGGVGGISDFTPSKTLTRFGTYGEGDLSGIEGLWGPAKWIEDLGNWFSNTVVGGIFGGGEDKSLAASGIEFKAAKVGDLIAGAYVDAVQYALIQTVHSGGWFDSDWTSWATLYKALDEDTNRLFTLVFRNMSEALVELATGLGADVQKTMDYIFKGAQINLQGKTGEEINKALSEYFSKVGDDAFKALFEDILLQYQKLNEGLLETAARVVMDKAIVSEILSMTNQEFPGVTAQLIAFSEAIIEMAGGLDKLQEAAGAYYDKFFTDAEKQARLQMQLSGAVGDLGYALPGTRGGYRAMVEGLDLTTDAGKKAYVMLLEWSEAADKYYSVLEDVVPLTDKLTESLRKQAETITKWLSDLNKSTLSPVVSAQAYEAEYARMREAAFAPGATEANTSAFLTEASNYLRFARAYSGDYKAIYDAVVGDVQRLGDVKDAQISAIEAADVAARINADRIIAAITGREIGPPKPPLRTYGGGGLMVGPSIAGERGPEWVVPTYEPQRSRFLESVPPQFWENLRGGGAVQGGGSGGGGDITIRLVNVIDGKVLSDSVAKHIPRNANLSEAIRRAN